VEVAIRFLKVRPCSCDNMVTASRFNAHKSIGSSASSLLVKVKCQIFRKDVSQHFCVATILKNVIEPSANYDLVECHTFHVIMLVLSEIYLTYL
jgi:hypothetical protein